MFSLDDKQIKKLLAWQADKPQSRAVDGAQYEYAFIPTSLGTVTKVRCLLTNTEIDLTDYDMF